MATKVRPQKVGQPKLGSGGCMNLQYWLFLASIILYVGKPYFGFFKILLCFMKSRFFSLFLFFSIFIRFIVYYLLFFSIFIFIFFSIWSIQLFSTVCLLHLTSKFRFVECEFIINVVIINLYLLCLWVCLVETRILKFVVKRDLDLKGVSVLSINIRILKSFY